MNFFAKTLPLLALALPLGAHAQSLWTDQGSNERSQFADRKATRPGDILTIVVSESSIAQNSQSTKAGKETSAENAIEQFIFSAAASKMGTHAGELPGTEFSGKNDFSATGEINTKATLSARAAVLVTDVLPNGNLVIEGVRIVTFGGETQYVSLTGLVRPDDITATNTVPSSSIANARVEFLSEGSLTNTQRKGWLTRVFEKLRPY